MRAILFHGGLQCFLGQLVVSMFCLLNGGWEDSPKLMRLIFTWIALPGAILLAVMPSSALAYQSAPLNFCNSSSDRVVVAVGYHSPGVNDPADHSVLTGPFVSRGWWEIAAGSCQTLDNPFNARYMFWYAWAKGYNDNDLAVYATGSSNTPNDYCVSNYFVSGKIPSFTYEDENVSMKVCEGAPENVIGPIWITPHAVDTWVSPNVTFTGP